ncbi:SAM-dependent methyltransferase [Halobacteriales archaeon QS_1_68_20]|nr:MAG: SAM-dependent methyltransferase [Halobacteriales archaeon QS_1_68_20]
MDGFGGTFTWSGGPTDHTDDVPETVQTAIVDVPVDGATCLEAGAGAGNTSRALAAAGAERVYAITNDPDHADTTRERGDECVAVLTGDLRATPLPDESVNLISAHALFGVVSPAELGGILRELSRVAKPDAHPVVDDYDPLPDDAAPVADLFAVENAASELASGERALEFYPEGFVRRLLDGYGRTPIRSETLLDPVPWTPKLLDAHADLAREAAADLPEGLDEALTERLDDLAEQTPEGGVDAGRMYSVAFRRE